MKRLFRHHLIRPAPSNGSRAGGCLDIGDGSVMFGYAAPGDTNLDWSVDILDVAEFFATGLYDAGSYNAPAGTIAAVPEPSVVACAAVGSACLASGLCDASGLPDT